jgi:putative inorganic carbon (hco3(-)) transporter
MPTELDPFLTAAQEPKFGPEVDTSLVLLCMSVFFFLTGLHQLVALLKLQDVPKKPSYSHPLVLTFILSGVISGLLLPAFGTEQGLFAAAFGLGLSTAILSPACGVSFFISSFVVRPWEHLPAHPVITLLPRSIAVLVFFSWLIHSWRTGRASIYWSTPCTVLLLFAFWMFLTMLASGMAYETPKSYLETFYPVLFTSFMIYNVLTHKIEIDLIVSSIITSAAAVIGSALTYHVLVHGVTLNERLEFTGIWGNSNELGALCALALPCAFFLHVVRAHSLWKLGTGLAYVAILLCGMWATQSRGAFIALAIASAGYFLFCSRSIKSKVVLGIVSVVLTAVFLFTIQRDQTDLEGSQSSRLNFAIAGVRMVVDHPFFGIGMGGFGPSYERYTPSFVEWGSRTAHSSWLLALAEGGPIALILYVILYLSGLWASWHVRKQRPELFLCIIGYGVTMSFLSHTYLLLPYLVVFLSLAARRAFTSNQQTVMNRQNKGESRVRAETFTPVARF